jgi:hypothetical protein
MTIGKRNESDDPVKKTQEIPAASVENKKKKFRNLKNVKGKL